MSQTIQEDLSGVPETALIAFYIRAVESRRPDGLFKDEKAEAVVQRLDEERLSKTLALTADYTRVIEMLKTRDCDRFTQDFMARHPDAVVLHIGCGLDTRFERVDNGRVEWYDLDLPEIIELRRKVLGDEGARHHLLACSILGSDWLSAMEAYRQRPVLFVAESVFIYFDEAQVKPVVLAMQEHFPGAELVFDAFSEFMRWAHNFRVRRKRVGTPLRWAFKNPHDLEGWSSGIRLLDERFPFQANEPRLRRAAQIRLIPFLGRAIGVYHYRLGEGGRHTPRARSAIRVGTSAIRRMRASRR